jgi:recombination protein RecR
MGMMNLPEPIARLIDALHKLPGIGPRSAERLALHLAQSDVSEVKKLAELLVHARERIRTCSICGSLTEPDPCSICTDAKRDSGLICIVERATDIITVEKPGAYRGKYHVLGGKISPLNGVEPEDLRISGLEKRLTQEPVKEIIIALGTDVEGDATSHYLAKRLARPELLVTRIAHGLPAGSGLEYADEVTLGHALAGRRELK